MRDRPIVQNLATGLAMAVLLALAGPGVQVVRADPAPMSVAPPASIDDGPVCSVDESAAPGVQPSQVSAQIAQRLQAEMAADDGETIVLNGRGNNYPRQTNPYIEMQRLKAEARIQAKAQER